jgi:hypothetical protein
MDQTAVETKFLPAQRRSRRDVQRQRKTIESIPLLRETLDAMPQFVLVLNELRIALPSAVGAARGN